MRCTCAIATDQYHGWECSITGDECMFLVPNSKRCAEMYDEGPDANNIESDIIDDYESECSDIDDTLDDIIDESYEDEYETEEDEVDRIGDGDFNY